MLITHSPFGKQYQANKTTDKKTLIEIVKNHKLLGDFLDYSNKTKYFAKPVFSVYGNHEDVSVIKQIKYLNSIQNFHFLDEDNIFPIVENDELAFNLFGVGGNFLVNQKLLKQPIAGNAGKVWATLHQFGVLFQKLEKKAEPSIFVSHVSPGKEPLLTRLLIHFMPNFWISGHMGAPFTCIWNQFTIREMNESLAWFNSELDRMNDLSIDNISPEAKFAYDLVKRDIPRDESWYKKLWKINLPDVKDGYAILIYEDGRFRLETFGTLR